MKELTTAIRLTHWWVCDDSVSTAPRFSLRSQQPIQTVAGSLDGFVLFCTHRVNHSITLWDIQMDRSIHTFAQSTVGVWRLI